MAKFVTTARGDQLDFDALMIKQQLAQAPMNIEVERRKKFIDSKEGKAPRQVIIPQAAPVAAQAPAQAADFEVDSEPLSTPTPTIKKSK